jgi:hypothetical protein
MDALKRIEQEAEEQATTKGENYKLTDVVRQEAFKSGAISERNKAIDEAIRAIRDNGHKFTSVTGLMETTDKLRALKIVQP